MTKRAGKYDQTGGLNAAEGPEKYDMTYPSLLVML